MIGPGRCELYAFAVIAAIAGGIAAGMHSGVDGGADPQAQMAAAEQRPRLIVFETSSCGWCRQLRKDIGPHYSGSSYQARAPLSYARLGEQRHYALRAPVNATPTLVLVDAKGAELDRISGYPGDIYPLYAMVERNL